MTVPADALYDVLPAVVKASDALAGQPLRALCRVLAGQADVLDADITGLYENWFAETCDPWVLPYLGEVLGYRPVPANAPPADDSPRGRALARVLYPRAEFARTTYHRRRKGGLLELQALAADVTGWPARAVEFRHRTAAAWAARAGRRPKAVVAVRDEDAIDRHDGPFDDLTRRSDLRRVASTLTPGRGSVGAVGVWVWRGKVHAVRGGRAYHVRGDFESHGVRVERYFLNPFGVDTQLFVCPKPAPDPVEPLTEVEAPGPLRRLALKADLKVGGPAFYGLGRTLCLWVSGEDQEDQPSAPDPIPPTRIAVADLKRWEDGLPPRHPFFSRDCRLDAVVDPHLGRVLYRRTDDQEQAVFATYHVGLPADVGGGYPAAPAPDPDELTRVVTVGGRKPADPDAHWAPNLQTALSAWAKAVEHPAPRRWVIELHTAATQRIGSESNEVVRTDLRAGEALVVRAAPGVHGTVVHRRADPAGNASRCFWTIAAGPRRPDEPAPTFALDGVTFAGTTLALQGRLDAAVCHATVGRTAGTAIQLDKFDGCLSVTRSLVLGAIRTAPDPVGCVVPGVPEPPPAYPPPRLLTADSVLDGRRVVRGRGYDPAADPAVAGHGGETGADPVPGYVEAVLVRCTVFGPVAVAVLPLAEDCVFTDRVRATNAARGCVRYSALHPADADPAAPLPPRYACPPDTPRFAATRFGDPAYARLADACPPAVRRGGTEGGEMGAFHDEYWPQREALLLARLAEYTPAGSDARLFFAT